MKRGVVVPEVRPKGLSSLEASSQFSKYGSNEIKTSKVISPFQILFHQVRTNYVIYMLVVALIIAFFLGKNETGYTIIGVITIVITVGFIQEYKAERAIEALKNMITDTTTVVRDGVQKEIPTTDIVPEDVVLLHAGDKIPADCIILDSHDLKVNESLLTGESFEISKSINSKNLLEETNNNSIFAGTFVTAGKCTAKVLHTGMNTRFGKIAKMISTAEKELPLQEKVNFIIKYMVIFGSSFAILAGVIMLLHSPVITSELVFEILIVVLALAIASFPEGFPVVFISTLAFGAYKMAQKNAIVNRMSIIETLGETTVICSDKTGTITTGTMTVKNVVVNNKILDVSGVGYFANGDFSDEGIVLNVQKDKTLTELLKASVLCNDARIEKGDNNEYKIFGSPTEAALRIMSAKAKIFDSDIVHTRIHEIPFSSERKMMSVVVLENNKNKVYVKGAAEILLKKCTHIMIEGKPIKISKKQFESIHDNILKMTSKSYRVMALAYKDHKSKNYRDIEKDLTLLGIIGMEDPPRPEVASSIKTCQSAGIKVKMITGDNKDTAEAISKEIGLMGKCLAGKN